METQVIKNLKDLLPREGVDLELRGMLRYLIVQQEKKPLTGVEIGVWYGAHAVNYLKCLPIQLLYLVDPYKNYDGYYCGWMNEQSDCDKALESAKKTMHDAGYDEKVKFIVKSAVDAAAEIPNELDFVYIDGNHSYEFCKEDIENYWPKVKWGGVIGGHDYGDGVRKAVLEFIDNMSISMDFRSPQSTTPSDFLSLHVTGAPYRDWFIVKNSWERYL